MFKKLHSYAAAKEYLRRQSLMYGTAIVRVTRDEKGNTKIEGVPLSDFCLKENADATTPQL